MIKFFILEENDVCFMSLYDIFFFVFDKKIYVLKGIYYWIILFGSGVGLESGLYRVIDLWKEFLNKIDVVYRKSVNRLVFFSGVK